MITILYTFGVIVFTARLSMEEEVQKKLNESPRWIGCMTFILTVLIWPLITLAYLIEAIKE